MWGNTFVLMILLHEFCHGTICGQNPIFEGVTEILLDCRIVLEFQIQDCQRKALVADDGERLFWGTRKGEQQPYVVEGPQT